jgi:hypothetical protein
MKTINCTDKIHVRNRGRYLDKEVNWEMREGNTKIEVYKMMGSVCCVRQPGDLRAETKPLVVIVIVVIIIVVVIIIIIISAARKNCPSP